MLDFLKDNSEVKVRVLVDDGQVLVEKWAKVERESNLGMMLAYRWRGEWRLVTVPPQYSFRRYRACRYVLVNINEAVAMPWAGAAYSYDVENWSSLWIHGLDVKQAKALSGGGELPWKWIIVAVAVVAVCVVGYLLLGTRDKATPSPPPPVSGSHLVISEAVR